MDSERHIMVRGIKGTQSVTIIRLVDTDSEPDAYGYDADSTELIVVDGCLVAPGPSSINDQAGIAFVGDVQVYLPEGTKVAQADRFLVNGEILTQVGNAEAWVPAAGQRLTTWVIVSLERKVL